MGDQARTYLICHGDVSFAATLCRTVAVLVPFSRTCRSGS